MSIHIHEPEPVTLEDLDRRLAILEQSIKGLVEMWETASGLVRFVKFLAGFVVLIGGAIAVLRGVMHQ